MEKEHLEILLENIDTKLDLVVEGHQALDKKVEDYRAEFLDEIKDTHGFMHVMYNNLDKKIDKTAARLNKKIDQTAKTVNRKIDQTAERLDKKIDQVDKKIDTTKEELKEDINRLENKIDTIKTVYMDHEERITTLELQRAKPGN